MISKIIKYYRKCKRQYRRHKALEIFKNIADAVGYDLAGMDDKEVYKLMLDWCNGCVKIACSQGLTVAEASEALYNYHQRPKEA